MKLDDLIRDTKREKTPEPDWKSIDEKLFARLENEPRPEQSDRREEGEREGRVVWIGAAVTLAAAAAALLFVHPGADSATGDARNVSDVRSAGAVLSGDVVVGGASAKTLALGDRFVVDDASYFESKNARGETAVRWSSQAGSVIHVEHAASPLVLSLEKGVAEAQVTPVPSGEAFAIDVTASSGNVVRVAVHGTHLRVAREGDKVIVDLTEGVVSIGAPPRRGSTIGTLVTAPAHVELDARDLASTRIDHEASAVRTAEQVTPPETRTAQLNPEPSSVAILPPVDVTSTSTIDNNNHDARPQSTLRVTTPASTLPSTLPAPVWLTTESELSSAIASCGRDAVAPQTTFATTLTLQVGDDGSVQTARFSPPLLPEARDCAANVIYKRTKLDATGHLVVPVNITR